MCGFLAPKAPPIQALPDAPPPAPQASDPAVQAAQDAAYKKKKIAAAGNDTLVTGGQGLINSPAATANKTAYGQ